GKAVPATLGLSISPNPFNPTTAISFQLSAISHVNLSVYDISGQKVATLIDGFLDAGYHQVTLDGSGLASGVYVYRLEVSGSGTTPTTEFEETGKMVLMK
ncbi:MAG: T9SS type A sorting domain-containing protein, partial [bacterium]